MLLDAGVPDSVGRMFIEHGHSVIFHRDILPERTPDTVVSTTALENGAILVACDGDMKQIAGSFGANNDRFKKLNLIKLTCNESLAASRVAQMMELIELEFKFNQSKSSRRMSVEIRNNTVLSHR